MAECGVNPYTISLVLNHVSARRGTITGKVYNQYSYDREKREALERWGERLESIESARVLNVAIFERGGNRQFIGLLNQSSNNAMQ